MESMKRVDVLKGIEQILVEKAYETGHISHRSDGDWQKQADGSWTPVKGNGASTSEPQPDQDNSAEWEEYASRMLGLSDQKAEEDPTGYGYEEPPAEVDVNTEEFEETKFDSDAEEKNFLKEEYNIDVNDYKDSDSQAIRHDLSTTYGLSGDELDYVADLVINNLPEDDEPTDDEIHDYEDQMADENKFEHYKSSHPRPALSNDGHSKGLTSEKDEFEDEIERFRQLTDPYDDERLTAGEAYKRMQEEHDYVAQESPDIITPAIQSGHEKFMEWIADFAQVEKSIRKIDIHNPTHKNMGF